MVKHYVKNTVLPNLVGAIAILCAVAAASLFGATYLAGELPNLLYVGLLLAPLVIWLYSDRIERFVIRAKRRRDGE